VQLDAGAGGERRQRLGEAPVELDRVDVRGRLGEAPGQHALARPDLEHDVVWTELGVADDRVEQVGVGEEVLPKSDHSRYQPNSALAFASTVRSSSA